ncbi:MAG: RNA-binding protein [Flavobacteriales bacterium]|nr:RNA-binding protein [Flavobacteriales bacterium]
MNIYVGNLDYHVTEQELETLFGEYGEIESAKVITDNVSGRAKGFAFVEMPNEQEAENAINELNGIEVNDRPIKVNKALPPKKRSNY